MMCAWLSHYKWRVIKFWNCYIDWFPYVWAYVYRVRYTHSEHPIFRYVFRNLWTTFLLFCQTHGVPGPYLSDSWGPRTLSVRLMGSQDPICQTHGVPGPYLSDSWGPRTLSVRLMGSQDPIFLNLAQTLFQGTTELGWGKVSKSRIGDVLCWLTVGHHGHQHFVPASAPADWWV